LLHTFKQLFDVRTMWRTHHVDLAPTECNLTDTDVGSIHCSALRTASAPNLQPVPQLLAEPVPTPALTVMDALCVVEVPAWQHCEVLARLKLHQADGAAVWLHWCSWQWVPGIRRNVGLHRQQAPHRGGDAT
jgi:hypothetical protein